MKHSTLPVLIILTWAAAMAGDASAAPQNCLVAGDSIAVRVGQFTKCAVDAKISLKSEEIVQRIHPASVVVVSAGTNDHDSPDLRNNLAAIRSRLRDFKVPRVVWIIPNDDRAAALIVAIARPYGDETIGFESNIDHVHPDCPSCLANDIFKKLR